MGRSGLPDLGGRGEGWVALQVVLLVAAGIAGTLGPVWSGPFALGASLLGIGAIALGTLVAARAATQLGPGLTPLPRPLAGGRLIRDGVYRSIRHPIYAGLILAAFGWSLFSGSPLAALVALLLGVVLDLKSRREEEWLLERYPEYREYRERTRRFVPGVY